MLGLMVINDKLNLKILMYIITLWRKSMIQSDKRVSSLKIYNYTQGKGYDIKEIKKKMKTFQMLKKGIFGYFF